MKQMPEGASIFVFGPIISTILCAIIIFIIMFLFGCKTTSSNAYTKQSPIDSRKTDIYNKNNNYKGYLKQSPVNSRKTIRYDKKGNIKGYWKQSPINSRKTIYHKK